MIIWDDSRDGFGHFGVTALPSRGDDVLWTVVDESTDKVLARTVSPIYTGPNATISVYSSQYNGSRVVSNGALIHSVE